MIYLQPLLLSGSKEMNVNGGTPKTFSYTLSETALLSKLKITLIDEGNTAPTNFGALAALTNGILLQVVTGGTTYTMATLKDNGDLTTHFSEVYSGNGSVLSILGVATPQGFLKSNSIFMGKMDFSTVSDSKIILDSGDMVQAVIQDNLTNIDFLRMTVELRTG